MNYISLYQATLIIVFLPLFGAIVSGIFGKKIGIRGAHWVTSLAVGISFLLSLWVAKGVLIEGHSFEQTLYIWGQVKQDVFFEIGFLVDSLTAIMLLVVTFVSFLVHIYSIGYMKGDPGYQRFFSYISMFTFAMLMLVGANNFLQLFFGWEGVGLASYLLIGFWFERESANQGSLKAFLVNRIGDVGFLLAIAACLTYFGSLNYQDIFHLVPQFAESMRTITLMPGLTVSIISFLCTFLFIGAMGKSAQVPLHVWLPESMEGPTPISALIHAATMVTAGIYMVARMSPIFEFSETILSMILMIGSTGALFTGLIALVQFDIKRVVAYSTLSQLGYMTAALGASAYSASIFHLMTHAAFKALLFLGAGSVIIALHHEQDMRKMGQLYKKLPITYVTFLIGSLSLCALPPFSGYYSKDAIIEAVSLSSISGATYGYYCLLISVFITALYTFRCFFMTFHGSPSHSHHEVKEPSSVVWLPLILLAIPSFVLGMCMAIPMLYQYPNLLGKAILVLPQHMAPARMVEEFTSLTQTSFHAFLSIPFWFAIGGIFTAWLCYQKYTAFPSYLIKKIPKLYGILIHKYGIDELYDYVFIRGTRRLGACFFNVGDLKLIDHHLVNGSGRLIQWISTVVRKIQTGYLYHYAFVMILGIFILLLAVI